MAQCLDYTFIVEGLHSNLESFAFHVVLCGVGEDLITAELEHLRIHGEECLRVMGRFIRLAQKNGLHLAKYSKEDRLGAL